MKIIRKKTKEIMLGKLKIGGGSPISIQSMTKSKIADTIIIKKEIRELTSSGCEIIRIAIPDGCAATAFKKLINSNVFDVPVVADIHFDYRLAIECVEAGADSYVWSISGPVGTAITSGHGTHCIMFSAPDVSGDIDISVTVEKDGCVSECNASVSTTPTTPIPTLNEWGMIILSFLLLGYTFWMMKRRKVQHM